MVKTHNVSQTSHVYRYTQLPKNIFLKRYKKTVITISKVCYLIAFARSCALSHMTKKSTIQELLSDPLLHLSFAGKTGTSHPKPINAFIGRLTLCGRRDEHEFFSGSYYIHQKTRDKGGRGLSLLQGTCYQSPGFSRTSSSPAGSRRC